MCFVMNDITETYNHGFLYLSQPNNYITCFSILVDIKIICYMKNMTKYFHLCGRKNITCDIFLCKKYH